MKETGKLVPGWDWYLLQRGECACLYREGFPGKCMSMVGRLFQNSNVIQYIHKMHTCSIFIQDVQFSFKILMHS